MRPAPYGRSGVLEKKKGQGGWGGAARFFSIYFFFEKSRTDARTKKGGHRGAKYTEQNNARINPEETQPPHTRN